MGVGAGCLPLSTWSGEEDGDAGGGREGRVSLPCPVPWASADLPPFGSESLFRALYPVASQVWASRIFCCELALGAIPVRGSGEAGPHVHASSRPASPDLC